MITDSNLPALLRPGQYAILRDYHIAPVWWDSLYTHCQATLGIEYETQVSSLGVATIKQNAGPITLKTMQQGFQTKYIMQYFGIGYTMTRNLIRDNQYPKEFPQGTRAMKNSLMTAKNQLAAEVFNQAFDANTVLSDGQPLASTVHPTLQAPIANTTTAQMDLSEAAFEMAYTIMRTTWTDLAGLPLNIQTVKLVTGPALGFTSSRLLNSFLSPDNANNAVNAIYHDGYVPGGYMTSQFILDSKAWFLNTDNEITMKYFLSEPLEVDYTQDTVTKNLTTVAMERYAFGCPDWRVFWCGRGD